MCPSKQAYIYKTPTLAEGRTKTNKMVLLPRDLFEVVQFRKTLRPALRPARLLNKDPKFQFNQFLCRAAFVLHPSEKQQQQERARDQRYRRWFGYGFEIELGISLCRINVDVINQAGESHRPRIAR